MMSEAQMQAGELGVHICEFPPELLARIVRLLAYFDILRASIVCKLWNAVIREDPEIAQLLHQRTCHSIADAFECSLEEDFEAKPVVIHPALQIMTYSMGQTIETAAIYRPAAETATHPNKLKKFPIIGLAIAHDFATRPTVTQVFITVQDQHLVGVGLRGPFRAKITNTRGVTVLDVLQAIVKECIVCRAIDSPVLSVPTEGVTDDMVVQAMLGAVTPDGRRRGTWLNKSDYLEGFRRYEGLQAVRKGLRVNAVVNLAFQPDAGGSFGFDPKEPIKRGGSES
ncbi:hypothetical protein B0H16DRAFT_1600405 [Mycena metata]|uniref:F-box domain-containing protein n=1 Tax=Mycena metata TaxID=1033252 RepID=A0AAD7HL57_9AGAR|nr:hypothetical protein B0H16DRAFT_1600405 [Mycena metata]